MEYKTYDIEQAIVVARQDGFTENELNMIELFWQPTFNKSWMYVSEEMVHDYMGYEKGRMMMTHFNERMIMKHLDIGVDYEEVTAEHAIVKAYFASPFLVRQKDDSKVRNNKKYYIISGEGFKNLLMLSGTTKGKETRKYYLKVEKLAAKVIQQNLELLTSQLNTMKLENTNLEQKVEELKSEVEEAKSFDNTYFRAKLNDMKNDFENADEVVYLLTTPNYFKKGIFKIGRTTNMERRQIQLNGPRIKGDEFVKIHEVKTHNSKDLESRIHKLLESSKWESRKEFFLGRAELFIKIMDMVKDGLDADTEELIKIMHDSINNGLKMYEGLSDDTINLLKSSEVLLLKAAWPELEKQELIPIIEAINNFALSKSINYEYTKDSRNINMPFTWQEIKPYIEESVGETILPGQTSNWLAKINRLKFNGAKIPRFVSANKSYMF